MSITKELSKDLYYALDKNELIIYYQPQIDLNTNKIIGVEALLRWFHSTKGIISPSIFIPIAEKNGLINSIGEWVLKKSCIQNKKWQDMGLSPIKMAVNFSIYQFNQANIGEQIKNILEGISLEAKYLEIEITERLPIENTNNIFKVLSELKKLGISIAIDDFGKGYSSLNLLRSFSFDCIKIDMQFIQGIESNEKDRFIIMAIVDLAKNLEINVIAEGVETKKQIEFLKKINCNQSQGYYFYKPMPADEMEKILINLYKNQYIKD